MNKARGALHADEMSAKHNAKDKHPPDLKSAGFKCACENMLGPDRNGQMQIKPQIPSVGFEIVRRARTQSVKIDKPSANSLRAVGRPAILRSILFGLPSKI